jgi:hypothetical protein
MPMADEDRLPKGQSMEAFEAAVRDTAYFLWEQDGRPEGRADEYWERALRKLIRQWSNDEHLANNTPQST